MVSVTYDIPDAKYPAFEAAFLEVHHVPLDPETHEPTMSNRAWIKECGRRWFLGVINQGARRVRDKAHPVTVDLEIIG